MNGRKRACSQLVLLVCLQEIYGQIVKRSTGLAEDPATIKTYGVRLTEH